MRQPRIDDFVRLTQDIPELSLGKGELGVIRSTWFAPAVAYEVEFHQVGKKYNTRCLLNEDQLSVEDKSLFVDDASGVRPVHNEYVSLS